MFFLVDVLELYQQRGKGLKTKSIIAQMLNLRYFILWIVMGIVLLIVAIYISRMGSKISDDSTNIITIQNIVTFLARNILYPFFGYSYGMLTITLAIVFLASFFILYLVTILLNKKVFFPLILLYVQMAYIVISYVSRPELRGLFEDFHTFPDRYAYCQNILSVLMAAWVFSVAIDFFLERKKDKRKSILSLPVFVCIGVIMIVYAYDLPRTLEFNSLPLDKRFKDSIKQTAQTKDITNGTEIPIVFDGWSIWLPYQKIAASVLGQRSIDTPLPSAIMYETDEYYNYYQYADESSADIVGEIVQGSLICQKLNREFDEIEEIGLEFATYDDRENQGSINVKIFDNDTLVGNRDIDVSTIEDNSFVSVPLDITQGIIGDTLTIEVTSSDCVAGSAVTMWMADNYRMKNEGSSLIVNGNSTNKDLNIQLVYTLGDTSSLDY